MRSRAVALATVTLVAVALTGCASWPWRPSSWPWPPFGRGTTEALAHADGLVDREHYAAALTAYDAIIRDDPESPAADRARVTRMTVVRIVTARDAIVRLQADLERSQAQVAELTLKLGARDGELGQARQDLQGTHQDLEKTREDLQSARRELAARQAESARLTAEAARLAAEAAKLAAEADRLRAAMDDLKRLELGLERRR
jgi:methyl-accepting chemotaxis protein